MCMPLCEQCGEPIKEGELAVKVQYGYVDIGTQEFVMSDEVTLHEKCLPYYVV